MTPDAFDAVDIDLLADYAGGALSGDDEARVARLVADDPAWREAYALLAPGMDAVAADLHGLGAEPEPMPDDVVARLESALDARPHLTVVPQEETVADRPRRSTVRRRLRWAAPIAVAAGVLAFAGVGVDYLMAGSDDTQANTSAAGSSADRESPMIAAEAGGLVTGLADDLIRASGEDYDRATLAAPLPAAGSVAVPDQSDSLRKTASLAPEPEAAKGIAPDPGFPALQRLRGRDALLACLEAIAAEQGSGPITVHSVDYARYQGQPALIVQFAAAGVSWAWASGPECGTPGAGADPVDRVRVG
jgi:hypothetical protein